MDFNRYFTNEDLDALLHEWAGQYPKIMSLGTIGSSYEKRPIWLVTLTNYETGPDKDKPAFWVDANIHATEISGTTAAMFAIRRWLDEYGKEPHVTRMLDQSAVYIVPRINPDGAALGMAEHPKYIRSGVRPYPFEDKQPGMHPEDIDGDGQILQMRIKDPTGDWKISRLDPRMMEKRRPDENEGEFYRLLPEGKIEDYDGYLIQMARNLEGLDFNRNFPFDWKPENEQFGAGPYPGSEPEIKAVIDFITSHPNINAAITFHTFSGVLLRPYSTKSDDDMDVEDLHVFKILGEIGSKHTGYRAVSTFHDFRYHPKEVTTGAFDDWVYDTLGIYTFTIELWDLPTQAGIKDRKFITWYEDHPHEEDQMILKWIDENAPEGAYAAWRTYQHPQLGEVEIGGWNLMYTWRNPPHAFIGEIAQKCSGFLQSLGEMLPRIEVHALEIKPLGNDDYAVSLVVQNAGYFPTYTSEQGKKRQAARPVRAELALPEGVTIVSGKRKMDIGHLGGRSNKFDLASVFGYSGTDNRGKVDWVLHGPKGSVVQLAIKSERAGTIRREIRLG